MTLAKPLVPTDKLASFNQSFQSNFQRPVPAQKGEVVGEDFVLTPSRYPIRQLLDDLLTLRASRQAHPNENRAQVYGGLGGIILEGEPGVGKTELVLNTLIEHGFHEVHHLDAPLTTDKPFYRMPVSLSISEKKALLLKAFDEGAVVVIDEINSSPMMEQFLNDLLMGIHPETKERPKKPGFFIIGTQNPITMGGRRAPSTALSRRMITVEVTPYSTAEMHQILVWKGLSEEDTTLLVRAFNKQEQFARHNKLKPAPTFRDLLMVADEILRQLAEVVSEIPPDLSSPQTHTTPAAEQTLTNLSSPLTTSPLSEKVDLSTASTKHPSPTESVLSHELSPASPDAKSTPNRFVEAMRKLADTDLKRQYPSKARRFKYDIVDAMLKKFEAEAGTSHIPEDILKKRPFTLDELDLKDQADFFGWEAGQTYTLSDAFDLHRHHYKPDRPTASTKRIERETNPEKMNASATEFLNDLEKRLRRLKTPARVAKAEQVRAWLDSIEHVTFPDLETLCRHTSGDKNLLQILQTQTSKKKKDASFETRSYKAFCQRFHLKDHVDVEEILRPTDGSSMTI